MAWLGREIQLAYAPVTAPGKTADQSFEELLGLLGRGK
jgi:hypothetical protein